MIVKTAREELIRFKGKAIGLGVFSLLGTLALSVRHGSLRCCLKKQFLKVCRWTKFGLR